MDKFKVRDKVKLSFEETGTVVKIKNIPWGSKYVVKIRKGTFNVTNEHHDYKEEQMELE